MDKKTFYKNLLKNLNSINPNTILTGLGEVLSKPQKDWAKAKLISETKELINKQIDLI